MTGGTVQRRLVALCALALLALLALAAAASAAPALTITQPQDGARVANATPEFAGTAADTSDVVTVRILEGSDTSGALVQSDEALPSPFDETWQTTASEKLQEGVYTAVAVQVNSLLETTESEPVTFTVDTTAPAVTFDSPSSPTRDSTPTLTGELGNAGGDIQAVTVRVFEGSSVGGALVTKGSAGVASKSWSYTPSLSDGTYTAQASQPDSAGNVGLSAPRTFAVDTAAPTPSLTSVPSPGNVSTPTIHGSLGTAAGDLPEATVRIYNGSGTGGSPAITEGVEVNGSQWSFKAPHLADGTYTAQLSQPDSAGNVGFSSTSTFVIDTTAPSVSIKALSGPTPDTTPTLTGGVGGASGDIQSVTVKVFQGSGVGGTLQASGSASVSGSGWSYTTPTLPQGTYTAEAVQSDATGNIGTSSPMTFTVDTSAPAVSLNAVSALSNDATPTLSGGAGTAGGDLPSVLVRVYRGSAPEGSVAVEHLVTPSGESWSYTPTSALPDGTYTAQAYQADDAGNKASSVARTFVVDTEAPAVKILSPANESTLHVARPTFAGVAGEAGSETTGDYRSVTLRIYEGASASGSPQTLSLPVTAGKWTTGSSGPQLPSGFHTAVVEQSDHAGNTRTSTSTFLVSTNAPSVTLSTSGLVKRGAAWVSGATPSFAGSAGSEPEDEAVTLGVYSGTSAAGSPLKSLEVAVSEGSWSTGPLPALADGTYTAQAQQRNQSLPTGYSQAVIFTVDADPPHVTLTSPANGSVTTSSSQTVGGAAGTAPGDSPTVTAQLFSGPEVGSQSPLESITVAASSGSWSTAFGGLAPGTYTVRAQQSDDVGNLGTSSPVTFTLAAPGPPPGPPSASFRWFPSTPQVGEPVSLVSTSTDPGAPITAYAWSLVPTGALVPGGSVLNATFSTPGAHVVRLSVTDAAGLTSAVSETVTVAPRAIRLIQPFPVVRIAGSENARGVRIKLFSVQTPTGSRVSVRCRGRGCPAHAQSFVASATGPHRAGIVTVVLKRFERSLRPGAVLEVKVSRSGLIGKYTRFAVRRGKLPLRLDKCLTPTGEKPMECPS
jgi:large repetitive protein